MTETIGRVKWFNNKAGYGFITVTDEGDHSGKDIFVHHSAISVENNQYKYLVQGEYVTFHVSSVEGSKHEHEALNVRGVNRGKLMCETRHELKMLKNEYRASTKGTESSKGTEQSKETEQSNGVKSYANIASMNATPAVPHSKPRPDDKPRQRIRRPKQEKEKQDNDGKGDWKVASRKSKH